MLAKRPPIAHATYMTSYYRAIAQTDLACPDHAHSIAGGWAWFSHVEVLSRSQPSRIIAADEVPAQELHRITAPRHSMCGLDLRRPVIMGILNVTPDSFSDGGDHKSPAQALAHARRMVADGARLIDVGGESTRPGAIEVPVEAEIARVETVIAAIRGDLDVPVSIDTRKSGVARAAHQAGAGLVNDVSGLTFDADLGPFCRRENLPICIMHAQGDPETMQNDPRYDDVLLDVYDFLAAQVAMLVEAGMSRDQIIVDPGIGFGKKIPHNLALLNRISLFHSLGCPILLGASRKGFIRTIGRAADPQARAPGSVAVALAAMAQGVQIFRVHDVEDTRQAIDLTWAVTTGDYSDT